MRGRNTRAISMPWSAAGQNSFGLQAKHDASSTSANEQLQMTALVRKFRKDATAAHPRNQHALVCSRAEQPTAGQGH